MKTGNAPNSSLRYEHSVFCSGMGRRALSLKVVSANPDDDKVIECAVVGGATHIITGDSRHLLPLGSYQGIFIVKAADFLALAPDSD